MKELFSGWCRTVTEQVRFRPDREAIRRELTDHYEDHRDALLELGYSPEEADTKAVAALGDPVEIGRALNRVHHFGLGVLWLLSRILVRTLAAVLAVSLCLSVWDWRGAPPLLTRTAAELAWEPPPAAAARCTVPGGTVWLMPTGQITEQDGLPVYHARMWIRTDRPGSRGDFFPFLELRDQTGTLCRDPSPDDLLPRRDQYAYILYESEGWLRSTYDVGLVRKHPPEFLELSQPFGPEPWKLRCSWEVRP